MAERYIRILNFYGIKNVEEYKHVRTTADNMIFLNLINNKKITLRY